MRSDQYPPEPGEGPVMEMAQPRFKNYPASAGWMPIESAPRDGTEFIAYCPSVHGLPHMASICSWHEDAGFCVDELREPAMWMPLPADR